MGLNFDRIADRFDQTRGYPDNVMNDILGALARALPKERRVLDAGVGTGRFSKPLQSMGFEVVGVDLSERMLAKAKEKNTDNLVRADILRLPFPDKTFEVALSVHVLHLIPRWRKALLEISRVTSGRFMSVAFDKEDSPAEELRNTYDEICKELGCNTDHPGMRERELPELLAPDRATTIVTHEHPISVAQLIADFESRTYSSQWMVPEEIHQRAIEAMREQYDGVEQVIGIERISLLEWDIFRIHQFASAPEQL